MVSRGYLENWANGRGQVFVHDKDRPEHSGARSLADATVVRYAYRTDLTTLDLEGEYAGIEGKGIPGIRSLAAGGVVSEPGRAAVIDFLDMHRERSGFADQARVTVPLAAGDLHSRTVRKVEAGMGDRIVLSRAVDTTRVRVRDLPVHRWRWRIVPVESGLVTGDGAVLLWADRKDVTAVSFPLSPTRLLVIGNGLDGVRIPINRLIADRCKRWVVSRIG